MLVMGLAGLGLIGYRRKSYPVIHRRGPLRVLTAAARAGRETRSNGSGAGDPRRLTSFLTYIAVRNARVYGVVLAN